MKSETTESGLTVVSDGLALPENFKPTEQQLEEIAQAEAGETLHFGPNRAQRRAALRSGHKSSKTQQPVRKKRKRK